VLRKVFVKRLTPQSGVQGKEVRNCEHSGIAFDKYLVEPEEHTKRENAARLLRTAFYGFGGSPFGLLSSLQKKQQDFVAQSSCKDTAVNVLGFGLGR
jgi:hypothetical protein